MNSQNTFKVIVVWVVLNDEWQVLLWKRSEDEDVFPGYWATPWWKVEINGKENDKDILEQNLKREILEETGIIVWNIEYLNSHYWYNWSEYKIYVVFTAKHLEGEPKALEDTEVVSFIDIDQALTLKLAPNVDFILNLVKNNY